MHLQNEAKRLLQSIIENAQLLHTMYDSDVTAALNDELERLKELHELLSNSKSHEFSIQKLVSILSEVSEIVLDLLNY